MKCLNQDDGLICTELRGHWRFFVLVCFFVFFSGYVCWIKLITLSLRVHVKLCYHIVSYRIVDVACRKTSASWQPIWFNSSTEKPIFCVMDFPRRTLKVCARGSVTTSFSTFERHPTIPKSLICSRLIKNSLTMSLRCSFQISDLKLISNSLRCSGFGNWRLLWLQWIQSHFHY